MKIGLFLPEHNIEHLTILTAFKIGLEAHGEIVRVLPIKDYSPEYDLAIIFGVYKRGVEAAVWRGKVIDGQKSIGKDYLVLEKGYMVRDMYYSVGLNGLNGRANFNNENSPSDRFEKIKPLIEPRDWRAPNKNPIILIGQVPTDASVQNVDIFNWCNKMVMRISKRTTRKIIFRPHPLAIDRTPLILGTSTSTKPFWEDLTECPHAVVTYNSNSAVDALIAGIPAFAFDKGSMAFPVADSNIDNIENPSCGKRNQWLNNLAYAQWNTSEMNAGMSWEHIKPIVNSIPIYKVDVL